jgi:hypothetical protein
MTLTDAHFLPETLKWWDGKKLFLELDHKANLMTEAITNEPMLPTPWVIRSLSYSLLAEGLVSLKV